jgi:hypothetical protein
MIADFLSFKRKGRKGGRKGHTALANFAKILAPLAVKEHFVNGTALAEGNVLRTIQFVRRNRSIDMYSLTGNIRTSQLSM